MNPRLHLELKGRRSHQSKGYKCYRPGTLPLPQLHMYISCCPIVISLPKSCSKGRVSSRCP